MINTNTITQTPHEDTLAEVVDINSNFLGVDDLEALASTLARSQGFYGRLLASLQELDTEHRQKLNDTIKKQRFTTSLDLILWVEG